MVDDLLQDTTLAKAAGRWRREWLGGADVVAAFERKSLELLGF
jgi:hypothetical protein